MAGKLNESRALLRAWLEDLEFAVEEESSTFWKATSKLGTVTFKLKVRAHRDGRQAEYEIMSKGWNPTSPSAF